MPTRYDLLMGLCKKINPIVIMEIGTFDGQNSIRLMKSCSAQFYIGFDLFEEMTEEIYIKEFSKKPPSRIKVWEDMVKKLALCNIELYAGNTKQTLKNYTDPPPDFLWVDGGHSVETIKSDWENLKRIVNKHTVIVFDDYYNSGIDTRKFGCNFLVEDFLKEGYNIELMGRDNFENQNGLKNYSISTIVLRKGGS